MAGTYLEIGGGSGGGGPSGPQPTAHSVDTAANLPGSGDEDGQLIYVRDTESIYAWDDGGSTWKWILNGLADVSGPASASDNRVARFDGASGKIIQSGLVVIDDSGNMSGINDIDINGTINSSLTANRLVKSIASGVLDVVAALTPGSLPYIDGSGYPADSAATLDIFGNAQFKDLTLTGSFDTGLADGSLVYSSSGNLAAVAALTPGSLPYIDAGGLPADSSATLDISGSLVVDTVTATSYVQFPALTTAARNLLTPANGMMIYNTDVDKFQGYIAGSWTDMSGWGA